MAQRVTITTGVVFVMSPKIKLDKGIQMITKTKASAFTVQQESQSAGLTMGRMRDLFIELARDYGEDAPLREVTVASTNGNTGNVYSLTVTVQEQ